MPRYICCYTRDEKDWYFEWSTVVDAPVGNPVTREVMKARLEFRGGYCPEWHDSSVDQHLNRAKKNGYSIIPPDPKGLQGLMEFNRAGENESCMSVDDIIDELHEDRCERTEIATNRDENEYAEYIKEDGTGRLCLILYGSRAMPEHYIGGSDARMLYDAAFRLSELEELMNEACELTADEDHWPNDGREIKKFVYLARSMAELKKKFEVMKKEI